MSISKERNMFVVTERFLSDVVEKYGEHPVSIDGGNLVSTSSMQVLEAKPSSSFFCIQG